MKNIVNLLASTALMTGCGTFGGNPGSKGGNGGTVNSSAHIVSPLPAMSGAVNDALNVFVADAPAANISKVLIKVSEIDLKQSDGSWLKLAIKNADVINLLDWQNGTSTLLAFGSSIPSGNYSELRLILDSATPPKVQLADGSQQSLIVPSGSESGIKIDGAFSYQAGSTKSLVLDFDVNQSIDVETSETTDKGGDGKGEHGNGQPSSTPTVTTQYKLNPVIHLVDTASAKMLTVKVDFGTTACAYKQDQTPDATSSCPNAVGTATNANGQYVFPYLNAGDDYRVRVFDSSGQYRDIAETFAIDKD